jgi:glutamate racemase
VAPDARPIGVFDSGLGGLTVLRELCRRLPAEDLIYFGDTARVPYGTKGALTVTAFARQDARFLMRQDIKLLVVACNTASAFALDELAAELPVPVLGVIEPGLAAARTATRGGAVGVIGTRGTITSGRYQEGLAAWLAPERIVANACPLFVPLVEEGLLDHPLTELACAEYLEPLRTAAVDTVILGCTHYPLLKPVIARYMGADVVLVDSAEALAAAAVDTLDRDGLRCGHDRAGELRFYLSDLPWTFRTEGARYLGRDIEHVTTVNLDELEAS